MEVSEEDLAAQEFVLGLEWFFDLQHKISIPSLRIAHDFPAGHHIVFVFETGIKASLGLNHDIVPSIDE
jgi:hypothetical protein